MTDESPAPEADALPESDGSAAGGVQWGDILRNTLLVLVFFAMLWLAFHVRLPSAEVLRDRLDDWGGLAWVVFIGLYAVLAVTPIPVSVLAIAAGVLFGVVEGSILSVVGAMLGSWAAYWLARLLGKATVTKLLGSHAATVEQRLSEAGTSGTYLLRLTPGLPYWVVNYGSGAFGVSQRSFLVGSLLGTVPGQISLVAIGAFAAEPTVVNGAVIGVSWAVVAVLTFLAYRELHRARKAKAAASTTATSSVTATAPATGEVTAEE